jgi:hypothetical protein
LDFSSRGARPAGQPKPIVFVKQASDALLAIAICSKVRRSGALDRQPKTDGSAVPSVARK